MILGRVIGLVLGYIFGLFPTGILMGKAHKTDLKKEGSGNTGMTNSIRVLGWRAGVIVFAGDFFKAVAAMVIIWAVYRNIYPDMVKLLMLYSGLGAVLGHNYPFYAKFKGGKGIACSIGNVIAFDWRMAPICAALFFLTVVPTGFMSLGSLGIISGFFIQTIVFGQLGFLKVGTQFLSELYVIAAVLTALAFIQHRGNLKRLVTGTENKFAPSKNKKKETED
ncbi:MAG: glycerol-3-phosphate acyltransferase [Clostridiales bacterium]|nr:glycerol-3-phosphate acyltransferase [Clostridiales bacterium]MCD8109447.1 glycerol-3-phosphate acyltransferase [Clostridiales bacterium]MCD8132332.1 glycerol-3-phosphate acyltransferase [Clostridiales bacterium]